MLSKCNSVLEFLYNYSSKCLNMNFHDFFHLLAIVLLLNGVLGFPRKKSDDKRPKPKSDELEPVVLNRSTLEVIDKTIDRLLGDMSVSPSSTKSALQQNAGIRSPSSISGLQQPEVPSVEHFPPLSSATPVKNQIFSVSGSLPSQTSPTLHSHQPEQERRENLEALPQPVPTRSFLQALKMEKTIKPHPHSPSSPTQFDLEKTTELSNRKNIVATSSNLHKAVPRNTIGPSESENMTPMSSTHLKAVFRNIAGPHQGAISSPSQQKNILSQFINNAKVSCTIMIVPKQLGDNIDIVEELQSTGIDLKSFGVTKTYIFPSKILLLECDSVVARESLGKVVNISERLKAEQLPRNFLREVRFEVPTNATIDEISKVVSEQYGENVLEVQFTFYKEKTRQMKQATLQVSDSLYKKMEMSPNLYMEQFHIVIDTSVPVHRCTNCQRLGHHENSCYQPTHPGPISLHENCLDCSFYNNHTLRGTKKRPIDVNHSTGHPNCPSKLFYSKKFQSYRDRDSKLLESKPLEIVTPLLSRFVKDKKKMIVAPTHVEYGPSISTHNNDKIEQKKIIDSRSPFQSMEEISSTLSLPYILAPIPHKGVFTSTTLSAEQKDKSLRPKYRMVITSKNPGINIMDELRALNVDLELLVIKSTSLSSSNFSIDVECNSIEKLEELEKVVSKSEKLKMEMKEKTFPNQACIHVPQNTTIEDISNAVFQNFKGRPEEVQFIPLRIDKHMKLALLYLSFPLLEKMKASPNLYMGGIRRAINTSIHITRCNRCQLLGHQEKNCRLKSRSPPLPNEKCVDCTHYNRLLELQSRNSVDQFRDPNHVTHNNDCPTKQYYIERWHKMRE